VEATVRDRAQSASGNQVSEHRQHKIISRRDVLRSSAILVGGAGAALASRPAAAASKVPQSQAGYKSVATGGARCDRCAQFQPPSGCKIVAGAISPSGSCDFFAPRQ
jgi:hypothetical protein